MRHETFFLEDVVPALESTGHKAKVTLYLPEDSEQITTGKQRPCVIIFPGGAYANTSDREAEPVALRLVGAGIAAIVVRYAVAPARYPVQLLQGCAMVGYAKQHARAWGIDPARVAVLGFSAGGHLAASCGTLFDTQPVCALGFGERARPDGMLLCYPVITSGPYAHRASMENLLGPDAGEAQLREMALETRVSRDTCKAFLWHTVDDEAVPVENTLMMAAALRANGIPFEMHLYPTGIHGLSLCDETTAGSPKEKFINPYAAGWMDMAIHWIHTEL